MRNAEKWIQKKLLSGVDRNELLNCVGAFSNKKKERVMKEKGLNDRQYRDRYDFLAKVYYLLSGGR